MVFSRKKEIPKKYFGEDKIKFNKFNNKKPDHVDKNKKFEYKSRTGIYNNINNKNKKNNSINNNINSVKIIPLGGLDEIGKNMTLIEYEAEFYDEILNIPAVQDLYKSIDEEQINGLGAKLVAALEG